MSFGQAVSTVFSKYATFTGRARRAEFWWWVLFQILVGIVAGVLDRMIFPNTSIGGNGGSGPFATLTNLGLLLPTLAVTARRLHDIDRSGWRQLIGLIPLVGWIIMIVWMVRGGQPQANRFGSDPKGRWLEGPGGSGPQDYVPPRPY